VSTNGENRPRGEVGVVEPMGNEQIVYVTLSGGDKLVAIAPPEALIKPGDTVSIDIRPEGVHLFDAESGRRIEPTPQRI
jgi:multiple sugar transport system ATP-binding protein